MCDLAGRLHRNGREGGLARLNLVGGLALLLGSLGEGPLSAAEAPLREASHRRAPASPAGLPPLEPIYRLKVADGQQRLASPSEMRAGNFQARPDGVSFLAVCTNEWLAGLVPVFAVEKTNRVELRRSPQRGQENSSEPLFFALPPEDEPDATRIAGRWQCEAVRGDGSKAFLAWELTLEADQIAGRFDQNTEYRYAYLVGGTFRSNRIELRVEYIMDVYLLSGEWRDGELKGTWRRSDDSESGTWAAAREGAPIRIPPNKDTVLLYEWRRSDEARHYAVEDEPMDPEWERSARPLCRVWRAPRKDSK